MSEEKTNTLKPGWRIVKFGDVVRLSGARSQDPLSDGIERYVGLEHLEPGDLRIRKWGNVSEGVTFTNKFQPGQVLFGKRRAYQRKVAVAEFSGVCSGDIYVLETKDAKVLRQELLPFICQTDAFFDHAVATSVGSLSPRTNWSSLADFEFALPPLDAQQQLIVALKSLENAIMEHESLHKAIQTSIQSILAGWWGDKSDVMRPLSDLSVLSGTYGINAPAKTLEVGKPRYIRITDIDNYGRLRDSGAVGVDSPNYNDFLLADNDLLIARTGSVGKTLLYSKELGPAVFAGYLVRFRLDTTQVLPKYVFFMTCTPQYRAWIAATARVGLQPNINAKEYSNLMLPVPPIVQQTYLVEMIERLEIARERCDRRIEDLRSIQGVFNRNEVIDAVR